MSDGVATVRPRRAERRVVSVVFADLVGFTTLAEQLDAEDVALVQERYFAAASAAVTGRAGRVEKFIGDAVVATFGVDRARADDAVRAVAAGRAVVDAVAALARDLGPDVAALEVRVGVNTGEVVVTADAEGWRVTGDVVNTAARLQAAAPPGAVLLGAETAFAVAPAFELERVDDLSLKGKHGPTAAWRAGPPRAVASRELALGDLHCATVGREAELDVLRAAHARASAGPVVTVVVQAPPGAGKSRLVAELADRLVGEGATVLATAVQEQGVLPYAPVADLLRQRLGPLLAAPDAATALVARLAGDDEPGARARARTGAAHTLALVDGAPLTADAADLWESWVSVLDAGGGPTPVWVVEDVQWASPDLRSFLRHAGGHAHRTDRLVVLTARPGALGPGPDEPFGPVTVLDLGPLGTDAGVELVHRLVGPGVLPAATAEEVAKASGGNPLFVEELLRSWVQSGVLRRRAEGGWAFAPSPGELRLPTTVRAIYLAQLDDLPPAPRSVVASGSVPGTTFPSRVLPVLGVDEPALALEFLTASGLLVGPHEAPVDAAAYTYRHALLRDTAYATLPRRDRAALHLRFAEWLLADRPEDLVAELVGTHLALAHAAAPALSGAGEGLPARHELAARAAHWTERAATRHLAGAPQRAAELFARARDLTPPGDAHDPARARRQLRHAEALRRGGQLAAAMAAFAAVDTADTAILTAVALGFEDALFESRLPRTEHGATSLGLLRRALAAVDHPATRARLLAALGRAEVYRGDEVTGAARCAEALDLARRAGDDGAIAAALLARRATLRSPASLPVRLAEGEELVAAARRAGDLEREVEGARLRFVDLLEAGDAASADDQRRSAEAAIDRLGQPQYFWYPPMWRAMRALLSGDERAAAETVARFLEEGTRWHYRDAARVHAVQLFELHADRGRVDRVVPTVEQVATADPGRSAPVVAAAHARAGNVDRAAELLATFAGDDFAALPDDQSRAYVLALCSEVAAAVGDAAVAARLHDLLAPWADRHVVLGSGAVCLGSASHYLGVAARAAGNPGAALGHLAAAVRANEAAAAAPAVARSRAELAITLAATGREAEAADVAGRVTKDAARLGLVVLVERMREVV